MGEYYNDEKMNNYLDWIRKTSNYDDHRDYSFSGWFKLKEGASIKQAVEEIISKEKINVSLPFKYCLQVSSSKDIAKMGTHKNEIVRKCKEYHISIIEDLGNDRFKNYCDDKLYTFYYDEGYGSCDDAATILCRFWREV